MKERLQKNLLLTIYLVAFGTSGSALANTGVSFLAPQWEESTLRSGCDSEDSSSHIAGSISIGFYLDSEVFR